MAYDDERIKTASRKIYLFELGLPLSADTFYSHQAGIWQIPLSPNLGDGSDVYITFDVDVYYEIAAEVTLLNITSLIVDVEEYSPQTSMYTCITQNKSFYYDNTNFMLYVHFDGFTVPWGKIITVGAVMAFSNVTNSSNNIYYNEVPYDTRIKSIPSLSKQWDNLFYGVLQYTGGSVVLDNADGHFETLIDDLNMFGQPVRLLAGFDGLEYSEFQAIYKGYVDDYRYNREDFEINIADSKKFLSRKLPIDTFDTATYPNLNTQNSGKVKPLAWGSIRNAPIICLNELSTAPSTYQFYLADTTYNEVLSVSAIYVNSKELSTTQWSYSTTGLAYVSSSATIVDTGGSTMPVASNLSAFTADYVSASTEMLGLNVITDLLKNYAGYSTDPLVNNYDSTQWALSLADSREVGLLLKEKTETNAILEKICVAEDGVFLVLDDGRFTFIKDSTTYTVDRTIDSDEWLDDPEIEYRRDEFLTSIEVKYDVNQNSGSYRSYVNNTYESTGHQKYRTYGELAQETILTSTTDVETKAELIMIKSKDIIPIVTRRTKSQNFDLEIGDIISAAHDRDGEEFKKYKLIGIEKDLDNNEIGLTQRWVEDYGYFLTFDDMYAYVDYSYIQVYDVD